MKLKKLCLIALLSIGVTNISFAGEWGVGVVAGQASVDKFEGCGVLCKLDDSSSSLGINLTYNFNDNWGAELGYLNLGTYDVKLKNFVSANNSSGIPLLKIIDINGEIDASALYLVGTGNYYFTDKFSITGRLGIASAKAEASLGDFSYSKTSEEAIFGTSLNYQIGEKFTIGLRADVISDITTIGLSGHLSF